MAIVNNKANIPTVGERVKSIKLDSYTYGSCIDIEFENGKVISAHISDLPNTAEEREDDLPEDAYDKTL